MKNKILPYVAGSILFTFLTGCAQHSSSLHSEEERVTHSKAALYTEIHNNKHLKKIVIKAAKEKGWRITKFTENSVIAEKFNEQNPKATTIKIEDGIVDFDNMPGTDDSDIVDLKEYIQDLLKAEKEGY